MLSSVVSSRERLETSKSLQIAATPTSPITRKACVKSATVSVAEKQEPQSVSILIEWAMRGVSATSATAIGITRSLETKANRLARTIIQIMMVA